MSPEPVPGCARGRTQANAMRGARPVSRSFAVCQYADEHLAPHHARDLRLGRAAAELVDHRVAHLVERTYRIDRRPRFKKWWSSRVRPLRRTHTPSGKRVVKLKQSLPRFPTRFNVPTVFLRTGHHVLNPETRKKKRNAKHEAHKAGARHHHRAEARTVRHRVARSAARVCTPIDPARQGTNSSSPHTTSPKPRARATRCVCVCRRRSHTLRLPPVLTSRAPASVSDGRARRCR